MSDETASAPENTPTPEAAPAPRARRISTPRPKKVAKEAAPAEAGESAAPEPAPVVAPEVASIPFPTTPRREERPETPAPVGGDWPEPDAESGGGNQSQSESSKRKRRRRKGKGQGNSPQNNSSGEPAGEDAAAPVAAESRPPEANQEPRPQRPQQPPHPPQPRAKIDPELLTKMAWKIYLAEVSEEGVALIGDNDAKDLSRRCFRLAEIFIEEQARRR